MRNPRSQSKPTRSGRVRRSSFSIVEMMIVVLILGIISVNVAPRFISAVGRRSVMAAASRIKLDLEQAKLRAKTTTTAQSVIFSPSLHAYFLPGVTPSVHHQSVYRVNLAEPYAAQLISAEFATATDADIEFNAFGIPDSAGLITVQAGRYRQTISIANESGRVELGPVVQVP